MVLLNCNTIYVSYEQACKPGSVDDGYLSGRIVAYTLVRSYLNETGSLMCLIDLAPGGVYMAFPVAGETVGSYPTFPSLPVY